MITPFKIYIVMQLDSINAVLWIALVALLACCCYGLVKSFCGADDAALWEGLNDKQHQIAVANIGVGKRICKKSMTYAIPLLLALAFIPSTRTAAAMFVIPAIANNAEIKQEAGEMYEIAKAALQNISEAKPKEADSE